MSTGGCEPDRPLAGVAGVGRRGAMTFMPALSADLSQPRPGRAEREDQRLARDARDKGTDEPFQADRDPACQRDRLGLQVDAAVALEKPPVAVQPPEIASVPPHRFLLF